MILIKNIHLYSPEDEGVKDLLIAGGRIVMIEEELEPFSEKIRVIDGSGKFLVPGFIDSHVHITGGGGEGSFKTRVPEITLSKLLQAGVTTVVGLLGTDGYTRSVENLLAKAKALKEEGISAYIHTGSYGYPSINLAGSVARDITFIDEVLGVKVALSDHRSSSMTRDELARLASDARVAGMLSGKAGIVLVHMGDGKRALKPIFEILEETEIPIKTFRPTHINRNPWLLEDALDFAAKGGIIDITCGEKGELSTAQVLKRVKERSINWENITMSSDGFGSFSDYDERGNLLRIGAASVSIIHQEFKSLVKEGFPMVDILKLLSSNVAKALELYPKKGCLGLESDADLLILDKELDIETVIAGGKVLLDKKKVLVKGTYE